MTTPAAAMRVQTYPLGGWGSAEYDVPTDTTIGSVLFDSRTGVPAVTLIMPTEYVGTKTLRFAVINNGFDLPVGYRYLGTVEGRGLPVADGSLGQPFIQHVSVLEP